MKVLTQTLLLLLFFVLSLLSKAQQDSIVLNKETPSFKNQIDLDVYFLGVEGAYKRKISEKLFIGIGLGGLMGKLSLNGNGTYAELLRGRTFLEYAIDNSFTVGEGVVFSVAYLSDDDVYTNLLGLETTLFYKLWKIKVGIAPSIMFYNSSNKNRIVLTTSLLIIKIPLGKW